ncbi:MAG: transposase, partial [Bacteroidales bacterium]
MLEPQLRKRKHSLRSIINAIFYLNKTGCQWRMLPNDFPPHDTVFYYFNKWKQDGSIEQITDMLHSLIRKLAGKAESPSVGIIDSRSVKSSHHVDVDRGIDGNKKIKGRKEHIVVDTLGLPMSVVVHQANTHDSV